LTWSGDLVDGVARPWFLSESKSGGFVIWRNESRAALGGGWKKRREVTSK
jgi:hypothetical protein